MPDGARPFDAATALAPLKAFQRATVDHAFRRLMTDPDRVRRFLVADEVGLGKTMVARGVIARSIEALWQDVPRINIVYVCSNGAIAAQNLARLNVMGEAARVLPTRLTLLALELGRRDSLRSNKVNLVSLTPGTTFELKSSSGLAVERAVILRMLAPLLPAGEGRIRLFQGWSGDKGWESERTRINAPDVRLDGEIERAFLTAVRETPGLVEQTADLSDRFGQGYPPDAELRRQSEALIGRLRSMLARVSAAALEPDLIILDEFQRFSDLLHGDSEAAELARQLFDFIDDRGNAARVLLLSATPYRMLTLPGDEKDAGDHHKEFLELVQFLFGDENGSRQRDEIEAGMRRLRTAMQGLPATFEVARELKGDIETRLRGVMARTERVSETDAQDAMLHEMHHRIGLRTDDLQEARAMGTLASAAEVPVVIEYWKSAPFLLSFMRAENYKLAEILKTRARAPGRSLRKALRAALPFQLGRDRIAAYAPLAVRNGRMRELMEMARENDLDRRLWMPPSLPYFGAAVPASKLLVFSEWSMVPDAVAALLSYEAERRMGMAEARHGGSRDYFDYTRPRPLQFRIAQGRLAGLRALQLVIPSPRLAALIDPLELHLSERPADIAAMQRAAMSRLSACRDTLPQLGREHGDWASAAALDLASDGFAGWLSSADLCRIGDEDAWPDHIAALIEAAGSQPATEDGTDTLVHLAEVALGSPATCALRALSRICPELPLDDPALLTAATRIGMGFRTLFNQPETQALLREESDSFYWRAVLQHSAAQDLQSVLDEHVHVLVESEGLTGHPVDEILPTLANRIVEALSLRPAQIEVNTYAIAGRRITNDGMKMRGRFAMRLTDRGESEDGVQRTGIVRTAFNSPFRPFVLATTSIGQEGLDFHPWCHRVVHWNLPHNPVDLEQREGRVHRYKNHAVRLNLAARFSTDLTEASGDPWATMFAAAHARTRRPGDLDPFWMLDGPHGIERHFLTLPFSREETLMSRLKSSVALYRLAFGQPRQDDFLAFLSGINDRIAASELSELHINLRPVSG